MAFNAEDISFRSDENVLKSDYSDDDTTFPIKVCISNIEYLNFSFADCPST